MATTRLARGLVIGDGIESLTELIAHGAEPAGKASPIGPHNDQSARDGLDDLGLPDPDNSGSDRTIRLRRRYRW